MPEEHGFLLILASTSPRRREMLRWLGIPFQAVQPGLELPPEEGEPPDRYVLRAARRKAESATHEQGWLLAADTVVALGNRILGKPRDREEAVQMLQALSGREHEVSTGMGWTPTGNAIGSGWLDPG